MYMYMYNVYMLMRGEEERKEEASNKAKQHNTPKAVTFPKKDELPWVGLEPTTLYTLHSRQIALPAELPRQLSWLGPNLNLIVHLSSSSFLLISLIHINIHVHSIYMYIHVYCCG